MTATTPGELTGQVLDAYAGTPEPRLGELLGALIRHLHAFAAETRLTPREWLAGVEFLTPTGRMCDDERQEFILLSDVLGLSSLVEEVNAAAGATEPTVLGPFNLRGVVSTGPDGRYEFRTARPASYPVPTDGPVGGLLRAAGRHRWRAAHIHAIVSAPGHRPVTTHIFDADNPCLDSDAVFGVRGSLVRPFRSAGPEDPPDVSFVAEMDFALARADPSA